MVCSLAMLQVLLVRWLIIVIDHLENDTLDKLHRLYQLLFLQLDCTLLVNNYYHCCIIACK